MGLAIFVHARLAGGFTVFVSSLYPALNYSAAAESLSGCLIPGYTDFGGAYTALVSSV